MTRPDTPFPRHRLHYIVPRIVILAAVPLGRPCFEYRMPHGP
jgi:hypothetical protein